MQNIETKSEQKDEDRIMELNFGRVEGLPPEEQQWLQELKYIYDYQVRIGKSAVIITEKSH